MASKKLSPWAWVPTLYFAQGLPYVAVNTLSVIMYKRLGLDNGEIGLYTGWLYLPWVIKPFWGPVVDLLRTKRWWILSMQLFIAATMAGVAFLLPGPWWLAGSLAVFWVMGLASATHDIAADGYYMIALDEHEQTFFVGIRSMFYRVATVAGQGLLVILAGSFETMGIPIPKAWGWTFGILSLFFLAVMIYHTFILPREYQIAMVDGARERLNLKSFLQAFGSFFKKPAIWAALAFMLLYRLPEAQIVKLLTPFLLDPLDKGGLGMTTAQVGVAYGTVGIIGLTIGGILGGMVASRYGLKRCLHPMAWSMSLTCLPLLALSLWQPQSLWLVCLCVVVEQLGYGFGFSAYMLYLIYYSEGPLKTSHYAICTGFMALSMMIPGMFAGYLQQFLGYNGFFLWTLACCLATVGVCYLLKVNPEFGRKEA